MENKKAAILVLAIVAAVAITAGGAYAMGSQGVGNGYTYPSTAHGPQMGPGMMGGHGGFQGVMGSAGHWMYQFMERCWNSTFP